MLLPYWNVLVPYQQRFLSSACNFFLDKFTCLEIYANLPELVLYFSHYFISSKFEAADEIMAKVQFQEVKMDFKTRKSSKKSYIVKNLLLWALRVFCSGAAGGWAWWLTEPSLQQGIVGEILLCLTSKQGEWKWTELHNLPCPMKVTLFPLLLFDVCVCWSTCLKVFSNLLNERQYK